MRALRFNRPFQVAAASAVGMAVLGLFALSATAQDAKPAKPPKSAPAAAAAAGSGNEGGLKARVDTLEEQLVDMQVVVGTLESLAKSGASSSSPAYRASGSPGTDGGRVDALEGQVRNLSTQVQQLQDQVRSMGGVPRRSDVAPAAPAAVAAQSPPSFGSTTVTPNPDAIGSMISSDPLPPVAGAPGAGAPPVTTAALPPPAGGDNPKQLYETAYGYLLQKDYGAAEASFDDFLKKFPADALAGNAQYWLGESHFVRGQYKAAAGAFLKGYQSYAQSAKAPDSLLKLAMSLDRLGQKDAACSSYSELSTKFPNAPASIKSRAQSERLRVGCP